MQRWGTAGDTFSMEMNSLARAMMAVKEWQASSTSRYLTKVLLSAVLQGFAMFQELPVAVLVNLNPQNPRRMVISLH